MIQFVEGIRDSRRAELKFICGSLEVELDADGCWSDYTLYMYCTVQTVLVFRPELLNKPKSRHRISEHRRQKKREADTEPMRQAKDSVAACSCFLQFIWLSASLYWDAESKVETKADRVASRRSHLSDYSIAWLENLSILLRHNCTTWGRRQQRLHTLRTVD